MSCPFGEMEDHEDEDDNDDDEEQDREDQDPNVPKIPLPARRRPPPRGGGFPRGLELPGTVPFQLGLPFPIPGPPEGTPQLPGFPPYRVPPPAPTPDVVPEKPLPGQPAFPGFPGQPALQPSAESAQNLVARARAMVSDRWRPTERQTQQLFGATRLRKQGPPTAQQGRLAVAEMGAAQQVHVDSAVRRARRQFAEDQAEAAQAERERQAARKEKGGRVTKKKLAVGAAAVVAGAGVAFQIGRGRTGGFGGMQVNMASRMRALTAPVGARKVEIAPTHGQNISGPNQRREGL